MRTLVLVAVALVTLPTIADAQRTPRVRIWNPGPLEPAPLPPAAPAVEKALAYRRVRLSVESYPLISFVQAPLFAGEGRQPSWTEFGAGTRADYRLNRQFLATLDLTSSIRGGPASTSTAELGARYMTDAYESRLRPFADVRVGYVSTYRRQVGDPSGIFGESYSPNGPARFSRGVGVAAGAGMYYDLTRTLSLSTGASLMRNQLSAEDFRTGGVRSFAMTSYRLSLGIRYNPGRFITSSGPEIP